MAYKDSTKTRSEYTHQLRPFILHDVKPTGKQLGCGSYGVVEELQVAGLVCAGKKIYDILIDPKNLGAGAVIRKYYRECSLLSEVRHPHVVQFLGVCFLPGSEFPMLVMEQMQTSLDNLLESTPDIPLGIKISILQDIARGLVFLHNRSPAVIHRDLTARNILLDRSLRAKIADLGNSRITNILPGEIAQTMTKGIPGTLVYMPPEASTSYYGPSLDIFSFGHLSLFAVIQVFPANLLSSNYIHNGSMIARTELQRRESYISILHDHLDKEDPLAILIKQCLEDGPCKRPSASGVLERLHRVGETHKDPCKNMTRLEIEREAGGTTEIERKLKNTESQLLHAKSEKQSMWELCQSKEDILAAKDREIDILKKKVDKKDVQAPLMEPHIADRESKFSSLEVELMKKVKILEIEVKENLDLLSVKDKELSAYNTELAGLKKLVEQGVMHEWETDRSNVKLVKIIGSGQLAGVWEGIWNNTTLVAVKMPTSDEDVSDSFFAEAKVLKKLFNHPNVLQIYATCLKDKPYYIITELMKHGNLLGYLHNQDAALKSTDLMHMIIQIANGMAQIESLENYVHLNLKASNVLVSEGQICKVAGFGYIKEINKCSTNDFVFPIRWAAPEVYADSQYSIKASVWSFGVLVYEVITKGQSPYPGMENHVIMEKLLDGYRMPKPSGCSLELYDVMFNCWNKFPSLRPNFHTIGTLIDTICRNTAV